MGQEVCFLLRKMRALVPFVALACMAGMLFPVTAQAANGVCVGRKVTLAGGESADPLVGTTAVDVLAGLEGDDSLFGAAGDDRLCGGDGHDLLEGGAGSDLLRGNGGDDVLIGGAGADRLNGGPGQDICDLGPGDRSSGGCEATMEEDSDRDGLLNAVEIALRTSAFSADSDGDGESDLDEATGGEEVQIDQADLDDDGDSIRNGADNCPSVANTDQANLDAAIGDTEGDACDLDDDGDGTADDADNCKTAANVDQANLDKDALGDACDDDLDGDQIANAGDLCPTRMHGDPNYGGCPPLVPGGPDSDLDGVVDGVDNCAISNPDQRDGDGDGIGDACQDRDLDDVRDTWDNCVDQPNTDQADEDGDGIGDACGIPTFEEFFDALLDSGFGIVCFFLGLEECTEIAEFLYWLFFEGGGLPPCICIPIGGLGGLGGLGGII